MSSVAATSTQLALQTGLERLRSLPYEALQALPESGEELVVGPDAPVRLMRWCDRVEADGIRVVLQSCSRGFCCAGELLADGFIKYPDQRSTGASRADLSEFLLEE
jgi:hypothetical protein